MSRTNTLTSGEDNRDVIQGKEVITIHQWPCDATVAASGGYRDIWRLEKARGGRLGGSSHLVA